MTVKLFWEDPYLTRLDTVVTSVDGDWITLRETIFYAFSGGQESDQGRIAGQQVLLASKAGLEIRYQMPGGHGLASGDPVEVEIDWQRRYCLMRLHFAAELILELVYRKLAGIEKIGAHIAPDKARLDFLWPDNIAGLLPELTEQARDIIAEDHDITSAYADENRQFRYWQVVGFARVPCGGTHLKRTGEVGRLSLKRRNPGGGKERIEVHLLADI
jgi:Ser-tRNA(Ala) deacylase AlaX